jgi:hypothetical protein
MHVPKLFWLFSHKYSSSNCESILPAAFNLLGEHQKAIAYFEQALSIVKGVYGDRHHYVASTLNNLGGALVCPQ